MIFEDLELYEKEISFLFFFFFCSLINISDMLLASKTLFN